MHVTRIRHVLSRDHFDLNLGASSPSCDSACLPPFLLPHKSKCPRPKVVFFLRTLAVLVRVRRCLITCKHSDDSQTPPASLHG